MTIPLVVESKPDERNTLITYTVVHKLPSGKFSAINLHKRSFALWTTSIETAKRAASRAIRDGKKEVEIRQSAQAHINPS